MGENPTRQRTLPYRSWCLVRYQLPYFTLLATCLVHTSEAITDDTIVVQY